MPLHEHALMWWWLWCGRTAATETRMLRCGTTKPLSLRCVCVWCVRSNPTLPGRKQHTYTRTHALEGVPKELQRHVLERAGRSVELLHHTHGWRQLPQRYHVLRRKPVFRRARSGPGRPRQAGVE